MTESEQIINGLTILQKYDDTQGDVSMDYNRTLFAGPQEENAYQCISPEDREELKSMYWTFSEEIGRWSWSA